jgi:hypothetical protein
MKFEVESRGVFTPEEVNEFAELFVIQRAPGQKISPLFTKIIQGRFSKIKEEEQTDFRDALKRYVTQYSFISQIISWIDPELEKFYLFTKLLLKYLPPKKDTLPEEIIDMVDMDKFRLSEQQNGSIVLHPENTELKNTFGDGHKGGGQAQAKEKLEVIVQELNERFHFDFEDRDKVMSIVIPKLANDQGLVAAFQTDNLASLQKQKFAESLENAFISSASDFYGVLNRMSVEPDFKRVLTDFALGEFMKGLEASHIVIAGEEDRIAAFANRARIFVSQQFGRDRKWTAINSAVWSAIGDRMDEELTLADVDQVAKTCSAESNEVLAILALLSRPASKLLKMEYVMNGESRKASLSKEEITKHLRGWWKDKTLNDNEWRSWAGKVIVKWSPADRGGAPNHA